MGSSGGGGTPQMPNQPTPAGPITNFGSSTPFNPGFTSVLGDSWASPASVDAGLARGPQYATPPPPPALSAAAGPAGMGNTDVFAQKLLDYKKNQQLGQYAMQLGPQGMAYGVNAMRTPAPQASSPTERLLLATLMQGGGMRGGSMGGYGGGHGGGGGGSNSPSRGGYSSSR